MKKIFKFNNGVAGLTLYGNVHKNDKALLMIRKDAFGGRSDIALGAALADEIDKHEAVSVSRIEATELGQCAVDMTFSCQVPLLLEVVADAISEAYQTDVTVSDARSVFSV